MKKQQIWSIAFLATLAALLVVQIITITSLIRLKMVPGFLILLMVLVFLVYDGVTFFFMFLRGKKPKSRKMARIIAKRRRIISCVLALVMFLGCVVVSRVANDVRKTFESAQAAALPSAEEEAGITRTVYVRTHDGAQELSDARSYTFGIVKNYDDECTQQAIDAIEEQIGGQIQTNAYLNVFEMAGALLSGKLDAMILNSGYVSILETDSRFETFSENTRVLADVKIEGTGEELDGSGLLLNAEAEIAENGKLKPFVVYISGSDSREGTLNGNTRSDVNILAVVNPETRQVLLLNTPRDYYVPMPRAEGTFDKLTHCGVYGISCSMKALEALYNCEVQYYVQLNFEGFERLVDAIGGITITSDVEFTLYQKVGTIKVGENQLDGKRALAFARTRKGLDGGDFDRGNNQMKVIKAIVNKATSGTTILTNYSDIMKSIEGMFVMNIPSSLIGEVVKRQVTDMSGWNIQSFSVKGSGDYKECYSSPGESLYVLTPSEHWVNKATELVNKVLSGETITEEMLKMS